MSTVLQLPLQILEPTIRVRAGVRLRRRHARWIVRAALVLERASRRRLRAGDGVTGM